MYEKERDPDTFEKIGFGIFLLILLAMIIVLLVVMIKYFNPREFGHWFGIAVWISLVIWFIHCLKVFIETLR